MATLPILLLDYAGEEIVDGEEDVVVVADGEDEHADSNDMGDEWEQINDNPTLIIHYSVSVVFVVWSL